MSPITDLVSPSFLHLSESLGTPLISMTLNIHNYNTWARAMWLALKSKNKLKFINGSLPKSHRSDVLFEVRIDVTHIYTMSCTNLSVSSEISQNVIWHDVASDLWRDLKHR